MHLALPGRLAHLALAFVTALWASAAGAQARDAIVPPPGLVWRPPTLTAAGAERPVRMESLTVAVEVAGGVAQTRIEMVFRNPNARTLEGKLQFPLGAGQVVSGFALDIDGRLRDAVPVEKVKAQQVFEDIARRNVDPGLLQNTLGNHYELRIYPLLAGQTRTVALTIAEPAGARLRVPLAYAPRVDRFDLSLRFPGATTPPLLEGRRWPGLRFERDPNGGYMARTQATDAALPAEALVVQNAGVAETTAFTIEARDGKRYFTLELPVPASRAPRPLPRQVQIVWDASASSLARRFDRELALLDSYFARAGDIAVSLVRVSDVASAPERFAVRGGDWQALRRALEATVYDGASNLGAVRHDGASGEALWFSDGLATYGAPWSLTFPVPVYTVQSAPGGDPAALQALADATGGRSIDLGALDRPADRRAAAEALLTRGTAVQSMTAVGASQLVVQSQSAAAGRLVLAGVLDDARAEVTVRLRDAAGKTTARTVRVDGERHASHLAALQWARLTLASLEGEARTNRVRIREIGAAFGLATRETSLLVLEQLDDYVRNTIEPPAELRSAYAERLASAVQQRRLSDAARLARVVSRFEERAAWWRRDFPKDAPPLEVAKARAGGALDTLADASSPSVARPAGVARSAAPAPLSMPAPMQTTQSGLEARKQEAGGRDAPPEIAIALAPAAAASETLKRLRAARPDEWLAIYLDERRAHPNNVGFYLDAGDFFIEKGQRELGLRVLSNLAEMDLQNRQVLRLLGYRLQQAGAIDVALPVFERVLELAPNEPQSHRDLGLALAAAGQPQRAIGRLYEVATGAWDSRFADIELISLVELNAIAEKSKREGAPLDLASIDPRLVKAMPVDIRVVLAWDADNTDVDLHVIDPNGEEVFYGHPLSRQGGAITHDATGGYGPEEFALRVAEPGKYRVEANFYGHRQQVLTTSTGLMLWFSSGFGTAGQRDQRSTVRVKSERGERVFVGEFEVKG